MAHKGTGKIGTTKTSPGMLKACRLKAPAEQPAQERPSRRHLTAPSSLASPSPPTGVQALSSRAASSMASRRSCPSKGFTMCLRKPAILLPADSHRIDRLRKLRLFHELPAVSVGKTNIGNGRPRTLATGWRRAPLSSCELSSQNGQGFRGTF
jgi:hypothetical protein